MKDSISLNWLNDMAFEADVNGHKIYLDASVENDGKDIGPRPKPFLMVALGGCTGMDVVSLLKKMRIEYDSLKITVEGDLTDEHPKTFYKMKVVFSFQGDNIPLDKVQKAVELSREKYCGVHAALKKAMEIEFEIRINE